MASCYNMHTSTAQGRWLPPGLTFSAMSSLSISESDAASLPPQLMRDVAGFVTTKGLIRSGDRVLCLVSGGADSVLLLRVLEQLSRPDEPAFAGSFSVGVLHVNYGRRGADSEADEEFVRALGKRLGVTVHTVKAPVHGGANFQAWARDFRYLAAQNLSRWQGYTRIAVGHNQDDRIETFIYRLITYAGRRSLVVMPPRRGRVIRPLLFLESRQIRDFCRRQGITFREDASNRSPDYTRNRIRRQVLPELEAIRPDFRDRILSTLALLEDEDAVLSELTDALWNRVAADEGGQIILQVDQLADLPKAKARLLVRRWLAEAAAPVRLSRSLIDGIIDICQNTNGSSGLSLPGELRVERQYDKLLLRTPPAGQDGGAAPGQVDLPVPGKAVFGDFEIEAVESPWWGVVSSDPLMVTIDGSGLDSDLKVRPWRAGDRFRPLGLKGHKSLQDIFVDAKIARSERERIPVVTCGSEIAWVCGLKIAEDFRVTSRSERLVGLRATRRIVDNKV